MRARKPSVSTPPGIAAVVLAAGRGVRFRSNRSKLVHDLGGRPIIQWTLANLQAAGMSPIVVVVGFDAEGIKAACGAGITFALQAERKGTGDAVLKAAPALAGFSGSIVIVNGDVPLLRAETLQRLVAVHKQEGSLLTLGTAHVDDPSGWGRIVRREGRVYRIVEERDATPEVRTIREVNVGLYCVASHVLFPMLERIMPDNSQDEIYLTDIVSEAVRAGLRISDVPVDPAEVAQVNSRAELADMECRLRAQINAGWMDAGVSLADPATTYIGPEVTIGRETVVGPNVQLRGRTIIGEACRFDGSAMLTDAVVGDGAHIKFGVVVAGAEIGDRCMVGPFAQIRPGTRLAADVHIGNFVETKNAVIETRTKANHLAYLGDTEIGCDTNIGAGTITCNYDGFRKHRTIIGDRVQVGSDSQLVAPITVADDVYVGTGTTVRENVPAGVLVYNEKSQVHRPGWVAARRARQKLDQNLEKDREPPRRKSGPKDRKAVARKKQPTAQARSKARSGRAKRGK